MFGYAWLKPSYLAIGVLVALLGVQSWRLNSAHLEVAQVEAAKSAIVADIATKRAEGVAEGVSRQKAAQAALEAEHAAIVAGLRADKAQLQKHYDDTYSMLQRFAGTERWGCLKEPLPESVLKEFRR